MTRLLPALLCGWLCLGLIVARGADSSSRVAPLVTTDGHSTPALLTGIEEAWKLTFEQAGAARAVAAAKVVQWGTWSEPVDVPHVLLAGGGVLTIPRPLGGTPLSATIDKDQLELESDVFGSVKLPLDMVVGIVFRNPATPAARDRLEARILAGEGDTDRLLLANGDELRGAITGLKDDHIHLETTTGKVDIELAKVAVAIFNPSLTAKPCYEGLHAMLGFTDGSRLRAWQAKLDAKQLRITLPGDMHLATEPQNLTALQLLAGDVRYLSDMKAASYRQVPFLDTAWPYFNDRSTSGNRLRAGGKLYLKGLGVHSAAALTYDLKDGYRQFQAEVAIDDETAGAGSVLFRVLVDRGDGQWQTAYTSPVVRGGAAPLMVAVDLTGAKRISLRVDFADRGDEQDHADWLQARLVK